MKYIVGLIIFIAVIVGAVLGFNLAGNNKPTSQTTINTNNGTIVDLSNQGLTAVDSSIYDNTDTTDLILSNNQIKSLPSQMGNLTKLSVFKIDHNLLEGSLIGEIRQMSKLQQLDASNNKMTGVPAEIGQLSNLKFLNLSNNKIDNLPNELSNLTGLDELNLSNNPLSQKTINNLKTKLPNTNIIF